MSDRQPLQKPDQNKESDQLSLDEIKLLSMGNFLVKDGANPILEMLTSGRRFAVINIVIALARSIIDLEQKINREHNSVLFYQGELAKYKKVFTVQRQN